MENPQEIIQQVGALSYLGLFGISLIANVVIPIPEEMVILAIGYVVGTGAFGFGWAFIAVFLGSLISDVAMFMLARSKNKYVTMVYEKFFSKIVPMRETIIHTHIKKIVFISRFIVNLRFIGPYLAGRAQMPLKSFVLWNSFALVVYLGLMLWAGNYFANRIESIFSGVNIFKNSILLIIVLVVLWSVMQIVKKAFMDFEKRGEKK
jgi:membrane protein DedA with SNARE-associated domain